jgi:alpha-amylase/alpha-mannosidase (GH57 family)
MVRSVCIHGHFYQPPRENPWLGEIEIQESAAPWHDWNERVAAECYGPNGAARILDDEGWIRSIVNNYSRISFNFGPTLLSWMERKRPDIYEAVLRADGLGTARFSGHGPALAQVYNHMILPLADRRDKETQVIWGMEDFRARFGRDPEGMWLAETAVDTETLEVLAENGIAFTILAPRQAAAVRPAGADAWAGITGERVDVFRPYRCPLPSGKSMVLFFYHGGIAQQVAFGETLRNGSAFASMLLDTILASSAESPLLSVATDGETFGHHHKYGDMALAYCLDRLERSGRVNLTIYGEYLEKHPPADEVRIVENSSWSCAHGVERWRSDCGCSAHSRPGWGQGWRKPLREALDGLRDTLSPLFGEEGASVLPDPYGARNRYISVLSGRNGGKVREFLEGEAGRSLSGEELCRSVSLLEMERNLMLMYTSCGWFFDELSGIETLQVMAYAARALELGERLFPARDFRTPFRRKLAEAQSNIAEFRDGRRIFDIFVEPLRADLLRAGAHFAVSCLFVPGEEKACSPERCAFSSYRISGCSLERKESGNNRYALGYLRIMSEATFEEDDLFVAALYRGGRDVLCGVARKTAGADGNGVRERIEAALRDEDEQAMVDFFGHNVYSLRHLFKDEQRRILTLIISEDVAAVTDMLRKTVRDYSEVLSFLAALSMPAPDAFRSAAEVVLNDDLRKALESLPLDLVFLERRVADAETWVTPQPAASRNSWTGSGMSRRTGPSSGNFMPCSHFLHGGSGM